MEKEKYSRYIRLIVTRLKKLQHSDGSWADNNFINALVAYSLSEMGAPEVMLKKSVRFILSQKKPGWVWNYYPRKSHTPGSKKYPDDLDDTFCSLIAIRKIKPEVIDTGVFAHITELLVNAERAESSKGGPYFTWVGGTWDDIDPVVNANISCFASLVGIEMPKLARYIDDCIGTKPFDSKYYENPFAAYYFIARNYHGSKRRILIQEIGRELENNAKTKTISLTDTAMAACALAHLGLSPAKIYPLIEKITAGLDLEDKNQNQPQPLYIEKITGGKKHYAHSRAFTLSVCGEAISLYLNMKQKMDEEKNIPQDKETRPKALRIDAAPAQKAEGSRLIQKTLEGDISQNMTLLPHRIALSLKKMKSNISPEISVSCGLLSLHGWMAYSTCDGIIDGKENSRMLPLANVFHREMCLLIGKISASKNIPAKECPSIGQKILDAMDCAQFCEFENHSADAKNGNVKPPSKRQMIEKSIGLALPSALALACAGIKTDGPAMKNFIRFFRHYIFVKQLSDDIRDWREDLEKGIITRVTAQIISHKGQSKFPETSLTAFAEEIIRNCSMAKNALRSAGIFSENSFVFGMVDRYSDIARKFLTRLWRCDGK